MKRIFWMMLLLAAFAGGEAQAQRCLPGMKSLELRGGTVDGIDIGKAWYAGATLSVYARRASRWVFGAEYLHKNYAYATWGVPKEQFTAEGGYALCLLSDRSKSFLLSAGGAAMLGYERSNRGEKLLPDGARLLNGDVFLYGGAVTLEAEVYLGDRIVFAASVRERVLWGSSIGQFHTQIGIALKVIFN